MTRFYFSGEAEVGQFNNDFLCVSVNVYQEVFELDVPMNNALLVAVVYCRHHLSENIFGHDFVHRSFLLLHDIAQVVGHQVHGEA